MDGEVAAADTDDIQTSGHWTVVVRTPKAFGSSKLELKHKELGHNIYSKSEFSEYVSQVKESEGLVKKFGVNSLLVKMLTERKNCWALKLLLYFLFCSSSIFLTLHIFKCISGLKRGFINYGSLKSFWEYSTANPTE